MEPTDWFRIRHSEPFPEEAVAAFRASCAVYRAKMQAILEHWTELPISRETPEPSVVFFDPEVSADGRIMSLPVRDETMTLGSRALLQSTASRDLYSYLPFPLVGEVEVGLTEPALEGEGWRHDWWNPHRDNSIEPEEAFRQQGFKVEKDPRNPGAARLIPLWWRRLQWFLQGLRRK